MGDIDPENEDHNNEWGDKVNEISGKIEDTQKQLEEAGEDKKLAKELREKLQKLSSDMVEAIADDCGVEGLDFANKLDFSKELTPEAQDQLTDEQKKKLKDFFDSDKLKKLLAEKQAFVNDFLKGEIMDEIKDIQKDGNLTTEEKAQKILDKMEEKLNNEGKSSTSDRFGNILKLLSLLLSLGLGIGLYFGIKTVMCDMAKNKSGCFYKEEKGSIKIDYPSGVGTNCTYDKMCGSCSVFKSGSVDQNWAPCCNSTIDLDAKNHKGGRYIFMCTNPIQMLANTLNELGSIFSSSGIKKILIWLAMGIGILILIWFALYMVKEGMFRMMFGNKKDDNSS